MKLDLNRWMKEAARLTRGGDLRAATAAIRSVLRKTLAPAAPADARVRPAPMPVRTGHAGASGADSATDQPLAGEFIAGSYHHASQGSRDYRLYTPPQAGRAPLPLVVMLHGCTQDAADFAAGTGMNEAALAQGFYVLYPEQAAQANPQRCWNWFEHSHQKRDRGEPALLAGMVRETVGAHAVDPDRIYVAGLSAGGAMAAILAAAYPDLFAAVGVHSGLAAGSADDLPSALMAMRAGAAGTSHAAEGLPVPVIVFHGDADTTVHPSNGSHVYDAAGGSAPGAGGSEAAAERVQMPGRRNATVRRLRSPKGRVLAEHWVVDGVAHAWSGGSAKGSYTDPSGPDATAEMLRFFLDHPQQRIKSGAA